MPDQAVLEIALETAKIRAGVEDLRRHFTELKHHAKKEGESMAAAIAEPLKKLGEKSGVTDLIKEGLGGGTVVGLAETVHSVAEEYAKLYDISRRFNVETGPLQKLSVMAKLAGTDLETVVTSTQKLQRALENTGDERVQQALRELKLSAVDLAGEDPAKQWELLAKAFQDAQREGRGFGSMFELMGRGAGETIVLLRDWEELAAKASTHPILADEQVEQLKKGVDAFDMLIAKGKAWIAEMVTNGSGHTAEGKFIDKISKLNEEHDKQIEADEKEDAEALDRLRGPTMRRIGKEDVDKANEEARKEAEKRAAAERIAAAEEKATADLKRSLAEEQERALQVELDDNEKIELAKARIMEIEKASNNISQEGIHAEQEKLKYAIEREKQLAIIAEAEKRRREQEDRDLDETQALRDRANRDALRFQTPREQIQTLRSEFAKVFSEMEERTGRSFKSVAELRQFAADQHNSRDFEGEKQTLAHIQRATSIVQNAGEFLPKQNRVAGGFASAVNLLLGQTSQDLILEENRNQSRILRSLEGYLKTNSDQGKSKTPVKVEVNNGVFTK
jgi:hypothetical protein